jgi:hypothetical protein
VIRFNGGCANAMLAGGLKLRTTTTASQALPSKNEKAPSKFLKGA